MDSAKEQRSTCGDSQRLFDALAPVVRGRGRSFVMYDEAERVEKAKTLPEAIGKAHDILVALRAISCNLSFTREAWKACILKLYNANKDCEDWRVSDHDLPDYLVTMERRMMNLCRTVQQGQLKAKSSSTKPKWIQALPWYSHGDGMQEQQEEMQFGFDCNLMLAWRSIDGKRKEWSKPFVLHEHLEDHDSMMAEWADGFKREVVDCTVGDFKRFSQHEEKKKEAHWAGEHVTTHHALMVKEKKDRCDLVILLEQRRQILQLKLSDFPCKDDAITMMIMIAQEYSSNKVSKQNLKSFRDKLLQDAQLENTARS